MLAKPGLITLCHLSRQFYQIPTLLQQFLLQNRRCVAFLSSIIVLHSFAPRLETAFEHLYKNLGFLLVRSSLINRLILTLCIDSELILIRFNAASLALAIVFMVHMPVHFLMLGRTVVGFIAETAAFVRIFLTDSTSLHRVSLLGYNKVNKML
jgi:hypothetical protein